MVGVPESQVNVALVPVMGRSGLPVVSILHLALRASPEAGGGNRTTPAGYGCFFYWHWTVPRAWRRELWP